MTTIENSYRDLSAATRLGANHGYRIEGNLACLNAELTIAPDADAAARKWALQLWACDSPYGGGALSGVKVAEAALDLASDASLEPQRLYAETVASLPAAGRDYAMVLVLASGQAGAFDRIHDFANYPASERFIAPHLEGNVGYTVDGDAVVVHVERLRNPRSAETVSGSLVLELWALREPYAGGQFAGNPLAGVELGALAGQDRLEPIERRLAFTAPPAAERRQIVLMLREWNGGGYVTRDFRNFAALRETVAVKTSVEPARSVASVEPAVAASPKLAREVVHAVAAKIAEVVPAVVAKTVAASPPPVDVAKTTPRVSIQTGSLEDLTKVNGLNAKLAAAIVKGRPYRSFEELARVRGIGDKLLRQLRDKLTL